MKPSNPSIFWSKESMVQYLTAKCGAMGHCLENDFLEVLLGKIVDYCAQSFCKYTIYMLIKQTTF